MTVTMYAQYQILGRENIPAFREYPVADLKDYADKCEIEIPDNIPCWETKYGSYGVTLGGADYLLGDVLQMTKSGIVIRYRDDAGWHTVKVKSR